MDHTLLRSLRRPVLGATLTALGTTLIGSLAGAQTFTNNPGAIPGGSTFNSSWSENVDFGDVDLDGDFDAVFADGGDTTQDQDRIWINNGFAQAGTLGTFTDETATRFPSTLAQGRDIEFVDFDNDGDLDFYTSNTSAIVNQTNRWFTNQGGLQAGSIGFYVDETAARWVGLGQPGSSIRAADVLGGGGFVDFSCDCDFGDLDNDGDLDLAVIDSGGGMICLNDGTGHFVRDDSGHGAVLSGLGLLAFDYDRDGDEDLLSTGRLGFAKLWQNVSAPAAGRHWLRVDLRGRDSNPAGVGARVWATVNGVRRMREVVAGQSFMCGPPLTVHFGLGDATAVELLEVHWPSGAVDLHAAVPGDGHVIAVEGLPGLTRL